MSGARILNGIAYLIVGAIVVTAAAGALLASGLATGVAARLFWVGARWGFGL